MKKTPTTRAVAVAAAFAGLMIGSSSAATVLYDFVGADNAAAALAKVSGPGMDDLTASTFGFTGGSVSSGTQTAFMTTANASNDLAGALSSSRNFRFTLTADPGFFLNLNSLSIDFGGTATAPDGAAPSFTSNIVVQSSVGGFGTGNALLTVTPSSYLVPNSDYNFTNAIVDISGSQFDNLTSIEFQIRFYDNADTSTAANRLNNVSLDLAAVPEPSTYALLGIALLVVVVAKRRRRALQ